MLCGLKSNNRMHSAVGFLGSPVAKTMESELGVIPSDKHPTLAGTTGYY